MKQKTKPQHKIKLSHVVTSPLLKFKHNKNRILKKTTLKKVSKGKTHCNSFNSDTKPAYCSKLKRLRPDEISGNGPDLVGIRKPNEPRNCNSIIIQMPKAVTDTNDEFPLCLLTEREGNNEESLPSLQFCMSAGTDDIAINTLKDKRVGKKNRFKSRKLEPSQDSKYINRVQNKSMCFEEASPNGLDSPTNCSGLYNCSPLTCNSDNGNSTALFYHLNGSKFLLLLQPGSYLYFIGVIELELLLGSVQVFGYNMTVEKQKALVFSLQGSSHLFIKATEFSSMSVRDRKTLTVNRLVSLGLPITISRKIVKECETHSFVIVSKNKKHQSSSVWPRWFENHLSFSLYPPKHLLNQETRACHSFELKTECIFEGSLKELGCKTFFEVPKWLEVEEDIVSNDSPKVILTGGKSVGKSTLLRYFTNKFLQKWKRVLVLDFDLGQSEFTVPGCISVTMVEEPVFGPNYTHLKKPLKSVFLGEVDVTKCPENYINGCKFLIQFSKSMHNGVPWLINTMGFTRGFGVALTCGIIQTLCPTHVVQIESKNRKLNFPSMLQPEFVSTQTTDSFGTRFSPINYKLYTISSGAENQGTNSQKSRDLAPQGARNLVILAYLSDMLSPEKSSLSQVVPFMIRMDMIELKTTNKGNFTKLQIAAIMNGNMVALCSMTEEEFPNCHGFGIVRGIDWQTETIYLITPLDSKSLSQVNCLMKGNIALPESLYYNQGDKVEGHIPYMAHTSGGSTSKFAKRDYRTLPTTPRDNRGQLL